MHQLSPHYRNDEIDEPNESIKRYLDKNYLQNLKNLHESNPKLLVVFSGGNAMGKSTISQKISDRFHAIILENDEVKRQLLKRNPKLVRDRLSQITWQYTMDLYKRLNTITPNGLIVRDGVIDWYYDRILPLFERAGYTLFVISFEVTREKAIELIKKRGDTPTVKEERFYVLLEGHDIYTKRFRAAYKPDVILKDNNLFDQDMVLKTLGKKLEELKNTP